MLKSSASTHEFKPKHNKTMIFHNISKNIYIAMHNNTDCTKSDTKQYVRCVKILRRLFENQDLTQDLGGGEITVSTSYITLKFSSCSGCNQKLLTFLIFNLCPSMMIFKYVIEYTKYLRMLCIPHEIKRGDVSSLYTHFQSYQTVFRP